MNAETLKEAGFTAAAGALTKIADAKRRLTLAYEFYRFVTPEQIEAFQAKLKAASLTTDGTPGANLHHNYAVLKFTPIADYTGHTNKQGLPPQHVVTDVMAAQQRGIFDVLEVAHVETVREYRDPIIFGRINDCGDRFFISQWGDDVAIDDLISEFDG